MSQLNIPGIGLVDYAERPGSPEEYMNGSTIAVRRTFDVAWADRWKFVLGALGNSEPFSQVANDTSPTEVKRITPMMYSLEGLAEKDGIPFVAATILERVEPIALRGNNVGVGKYDKARITIGFEGIEYTVRTDADLINIQQNRDEGYLRRFVSKKYIPMGEILTLPHGAYKWVLVNAQGQEQVGHPVIGSHIKPVPGAELQLTWHRAPRAPVPAIENCLGALNSASFCDYDRGKLLLTAVTVNPYKWFTGSRLYDINYRFKVFRPDLTAAAVANYDHNYFFYQVNDGVPVYQQLTHSGISKDAVVVNPPLSPGVPVFAYKNFNTLFQPGAQHGRI